MLQAVFGTSNIEHQITIFGKQYVIRVADEFTSAVSSIPARADSLPQGDWCLKQVGSHQCAMTAGTQPIKRLRVNISVRLNVVQWQFEWHPSVMIISGTFASSFLISHPRRNILPVSNGELLTV